MPPPPKKTTNTPHPPAWNSGSPRKYPQNAGKFPKTIKMHIFFVFFLYFWGYFLGLPEFWPGGLFSFGIFCENSGSGHLRSTLISSTPYPSVSAFAGRNSDHGRSKTQTKNSDHPRLCFRWGKEKTQTISVKRAPAYQPILGENSPILAENSPIVAERIRQILWSKILGRENSDHGLSLGCFWGRGRRGGSHQGSVAGRGILKSENLIKHLSELELSSPHTQGQLLLRSNAGFRAFPCESKMYQFPWRPKAP